MLQYLGQYPVTDSVVWSPIHIPWHNNRVQCDRGYLFTFKTVVNGIDPNQYFFLTILGELLRETKTQKFVSAHAHNSPFPSCCTPQFQSESWCTTIQMVMSCVFLCKSNSFPLQKLSTKTHFETETNSNSEMAHSLIHISTWICHVV